MRFEKKPDYWKKRAWQSLVSWRVCEGLNAILSTVYHVWVLLCYSLGELDWMPNSECYRRICLGCSGLHQWGSLCVLFNILNQAKNTWRTALSGALCDSEYPKNGPRTVSMSAFSANFFLINECITIILFLGFTPKLKSSNSWCIPENWRNKTRRGERGLLIHFK